MLLIGLKESYLELDSKTLLDNAFQPTAHSLRYFPASGRC